MSNSPSTLSFGADKRNSSKTGTFGIPYGEMKKLYFREYSKDKIGSESPAPNKYMVSPSDFSTEKHGYKTMTREPRECPMVSVDQKKTKLISPQRYNAFESQFTKNKYNSPSWGTRAPRRLNIGGYTPVNAKLIEKGIYF